MSFFQRWAAKRLARKHAQRARALQTPLADGETIEWAGVAVAVDLAEQLGRGQGDGTLVITTDRLIFRRDANGKEIALPIGDVAQMMATGHGSPPGMIELGLMTTDREGLRFYVGASTVGMLHEAYPEKWTT